MNKKIVGSAVIILVAGVAKAWQSNKPITRVVLGSYVFVFLLSILDFFGGDLSKLAGALASLTVVYILLNQLPWATILGTLTGSGSGGSNYGGAPPVTGGGGPGGPGSGGTFA